MEKAPMADAHNIIVETLRAKRALVAAGASSMPKTSIVPTVWKETMTVSAIIASMMPWNRREEKPEMSACSALKQRRRNGL